MVKPSAWPRASEGNQPTAFGRGLRSDGRFLYSGVMNSSLSRVSLTAAFLLTSQALGFSNSGALWPGWLGPSRDGQVDHFQVPDPWPTQLKERWRVEVGSGYSTPLVVGNRVYHHANQGDEDLVWCLDLETGKPVWRKAYEVYFVPGQGGTQHGKGPKSSPAFANDRLFTMSITGVLSAWKGDSGELLWRQDFKKRFPDNHPYWGVSTSPLVDGDQVIVQIGDDEKGAFVALDVKTGEEVWSHGDAATSYSSPIVLEVDGVRQIVMWNQPGLVSIESQTGKRLWTYAFAQVGNNQNTTTPIPFKGRLILGGENRGMRGVEPRLVDGQWTVKEHWRQDDVALDMSTGVINGDHFYGFSHYRRGQFFCLDPMTGEVLWKGEGRTGENVAFLSIPGHVVALVNEGELRILKPSPEQYECLQTYRVAEAHDLATWTAPALLSDSILMKERDALKLLSLK